MIELVRYMTQNAVTTVPMIVIWAIIARATDFPKSQLVADIFAILVLPCAIAVHMSYLDELFLMTGTVTYMASTVLAYINPSKKSGVKPDYQMVAHHVLTVVLIMMGCSSEQALKQKFMTFTLLVEISSPFVSHWRRHKSIARFQLLLAVFFVVRILGFGIYVAYMSYLAVAPNDRFDHRLLHRGIAVFHLALFLLFVQWFQKQLKIYKNYGENKKKTHDEVYEACGIHCAWVCSEPCAQCDHEPECGIYCD